MSVNELNDIERLAIKAAVANRPFSGCLDPDNRNIQLFFIQLIIQAGGLVRRFRFQPDRISTERKSDGSIVTPAEMEIETFISDAVTRVFPDFSFVGEETGGKFSEEKVNVAVDPVDGSWSFVTHDSTNAISIAVFKEGRNIFGCVLNPATGELGYAFKNNRTRLLQLSVFGENHYGCKLPIAEPSGNEKRIRVNLQPADGHRKIEKMLKDAWDAGKIKYVKSTGGSPANALLEASKGFFVYVHPWTRPSAIYDLAAGVKLLENAGGIITDINNNRIKLMGHSGTIIAAVERDHHKIVTKILAG